MAVGSVAVLSCSGSVVRVRVGARVSVRVGARVRVRVRARVRLGLGFEHGALHDLLGEVRVHTTWG